MPATTDYSTSLSSSFSLINTSMDSAAAMEAELESFHKNLAGRFLDLSSPSSDFLSISWIRKLLDAFLSVQDQFCAILFTHKTLLLRPPLDRMVSDYFERSVKALDVCNAIRDGIELIRTWQKLLEIVQAALSNHHQRGLGEGQFRRAKKALIDLAIGMLDEKDSTSAAAIFSHRNRSFGRNSNPNRNNLGHFRSLSWSVSRSWSAARQLQAIATNMAAPRPNEVVATSGLALAVYGANSVLFFAMWVLVAAIPCQDRGLQVHFSVARHLPWAAPMMALHDRIVDESKKRERRNACGLLREIQEIEKCSRMMSELVEEKEKEKEKETENEVRLKVEELGLVVEALRYGLDPLERQVRQVFHTIVRSRTQGLDSFSLGRTNYSE